MSEEESGLGSTLIRPAREIPRSMGCLDEEEVLAFLDGRLGPEARQGVEAHLDQCPDCRRLLAFVAQDEDQAGLRPRAEDSGASDPDLLGAGQRVDHFEIERLLGKGGMGEIYLAHDTQLHRPVALKVIAPGLLDAPEAQERFMVEARATARFNHPHIVTIHSVGRHRERPYLALEYVEGQTLKARLDQGPIPLTEALQLARAIAAALVEAHRHQVLHRDLKPHNVMIGRDGRARVLDFGLAKLFKRAPSDPQSMFETRVDGKETLRGTPGYMAPEQWRHEAVGAPADVWALGIILYELLSGTRPYRESSPIAYAVKVCESGPAPGLPRATGLPEAVPTLVAACLEKSPAARPTAAQVLEALDELLGDESLKLANELERAAERWEASGQPERTLWDRAKLDSAQRALEQRAFPLAAPAAKFLSASLRLDSRRAEDRRRRLLYSVLGLATLAVTLGLLTRQAVLERSEAERERQRAERSTAAALLEGARAALARGEPSEARAKLRSASELGDAPAARVLLSALERSPLLATAQLGTGLYDLAISPDGQTVAVAAQDHTIYLYDGELLGGRSLRGHQDQVVELAFAPDGRRLASASWSGELRLWNLADGSARAMPPGPRPTALAFDPSGQRLAVADLQGGLHLYEVEGNNPARALAAAGISADLAFSADGKSLYTADRDGQARRYDLASGAVVQSFREAGPGTPLVTLVVDGGALWVGGEDGRVTRFASDGAAQRPTTRSGAIQRLRLGRDGTLYGAGADHQVWRLDPQTGAVESIGQHQGGVWGLALGAEAVYSAGQDGSVKAWRRTPGPAPAVGPSDSVAALAWTQSGDLLSGGYDRRILRWDQGQARPLNDRAEGTLYGLATAGPYYASASLDGVVRLGHWDGPEPARPLLGHRQGVYAVAFDPGGQRLASASSDGSVRLWDPSSGQAIGVLEGHQGPVFALAFSPDGRTLASGGADLKVRLWDPAQAQRAPRILLGPTGPIRGLAYAPDGQSLAVVGYDGAVRRYSLPSGEVQVWGHHQGRIYAVAWAPDGQSLATAGADSVIRIWDANGQVRRQIEGHQGEINALAYSPDGAVLASAGDDATVRRFVAATGLALDHPQVLGAGPGLKARLEAAVSARVEGETVCLSDGLQVEAWDRGQAHARFRAPLPGRAQVWVLGEGCLALRQGELLRFDGSGAFRTIASGVQAAGTEGDQILYASGERVRRLRADGSVAADLGTGPGVTALAAEGAQLWAGYDNGTVEPLGEARSLGEGGTSPVTTLHLGQGLIAVGHQDGRLELLESETGARLETARLHGPIVAITGTDAWSGVSTLGQRWQGPDHLYTPWCERLRSVWSTTPYAWQLGRITRQPAPKEHPCITD